jgi:hypothetical protein
MVQLLRESCSWVPLPAGAAATAAFRPQQNRQRQIPSASASVTPFRRRRPAHVTDGVHGAWRTARGYSLRLATTSRFALRAWWLLSFAQLMYGASSPYLDAALAVQLLVVAMAAEYVGEMIGKTLLGVGAGRLASLVIGLSFAAAVLTLPLIMMLGVVGAALALAITNLIRLVVAWLALRWLSAKEATTAELVRTAEAA